MKFYPSCFVSLLVAVAVDDTAISSTCLSWDCLWCCRLCNKSSNRGRILGRDFRCHFEENCKALCNTCSCTTVVTTINSNYCRGMFLFLPVKCLNDRNRFFSSRNLIFYKIEPFIPIVWHRHKRCSSWCCLTRRAHIKLCPITTYECSIDA